MGLTLTLTPETEDWIRAESTRKGVPPEDFAAEALEEQRLIALIQHIGRPTASQERMRFLLKRSRVSPLTDEERAELRTLTDEAEQLTAERLTALSELARLRGTTLIETAENLGIRAPEPI
jgi:hypothetical protein